MGAGGLCQLSVSPKGSDRKLTDWLVWKKIDCVRAYTAWRGDDLIYMGMSGRGARAEDFVVVAGSEAEALGCGLALTRMPLDGDLAISSISMSAIVFSFRS